MPMMMILVLMTLMIAYTSKLCESSVTTPKHYGPNALYPKKYKCFKRKSLLKIPYIIHRESPKNAPPHQQNLFLVAELSLLGLFRFCPVCQLECDRTVDSRLGTKITVTQNVSPAHFLQVGILSPQLETFLLGTSCCLPLSSLVVEAQQRC